MVVTVRVAVLGACTTPSTPAARPTATGRDTWPISRVECRVAEPTASPRTVRDIDWCNHTYEGFPGKPLVVVGGVREDHVYIDVCGGEHSTDRAWLSDVAYGDLDGDGREEAALLVHEVHLPCGAATIGPTYGGWLHVVTMRDGKLAQLPRQATAFAPRWTLSIDREVALGFESGDGSCTDAWTLAGGTLQRRERRCAPLQHAEAAP